MEKFEIINFKAKDGIYLDGFISKSNQKTTKALIQIHGMTSNCFKNRNKIIAKEMKKIKIDTISFNNRGSEVIKYISDGKSKKLAGTAYENIEESYEDIVGAIEYAIYLGYDEIYLQGHSLGCTKILYTYDKLLKENSVLIGFIKGILLLSLVDIPGVVNLGTKAEFIKLAEEKEKNGEEMEMMPIESFIHPLSVHTYLKYVKYNEFIDFAQYDKTEYEFKILNSIKCPLFMRWGNVKEMIKQEPSELVEILNKKIKNDVKDIDYIDGADHGYHGKEEILVDEIRKFLEKV